MAAFELSDLERKLLRLALCESVQPTALSGGSSGAEAALHMSRPDYGPTRMPFGKHKGEMVYLRFIRRWINYAPDRATRFKDLADAIEQFLQQT